MAAAYGWSDLDLGHGFHATKQGERYHPQRVRPPHRPRPLLALNHQRYAEEVKAGLHEKKSKARSPKSKAGAAAAPTELLPGPQSELSLE